jgi:hypothetical protein
LHRKVNQEINQNETMAKLLRGKLGLNSGSAKTGTTPETGCWPGFGFLVHASVLNGDRKAME